MAPGFFFTGSTGYIGGDVLAEIVEAFPDSAVTCLVRDSEKGAQVASQYPKASLVYGSLGDAELLEKEARKADVVINCANCDDEGAAHALVRGLKAREREGPGLLLHTSGTGILMVKDTDAVVYGEEALKVYDDWDGVSEVTSLPDHAAHRLVDKIIIEAESPKLHTAIICPPTIYGIGRGPSNRRGHQLYELARCTLERKKGFQVGSGKTHWTNIHVYDMSRCYLALVKAAMEGGGTASWGREGYYFTENGDHIWGNISKKVAHEAYNQGLLPSDEVESISAQEADQLSPRGSALWGANSRGKAIRARKLLDWVPLEDSLEHQIPEAVQSEAKRLGLIKGHAANVIG